MLAKNTQLRTMKITTWFDPDTHDLLRHRAIKRAASVEGYIKQLLNTQIRLNTPPTTAENFNRLYLLTRHHPANHIAVIGSYPPLYLQYLDNLIKNLPMHYNHTGISRRRLIETLTLIDLFN